MKGKAKNAKGFLGFKKYTVEASSPVKVTPVSPGAFEKFLEEQQKLAEVFLAEGMHSVEIAVGKEGTEVVVDEYAGGEVPHIPSTVAGGITPWDAAKKIRKHARVLSQISETPSPSLVLLERAINQRTSKAERLRLLELVKLELVNSSRQNRAYLKEIQVLAQHLPTQPNLPNGRAENVLRAIKAVLKNYEGGQNGEEFVPEEE